MQANTMHESNDVVKAGGEDCGGRRRRGGEMVKCCEREGGSKGGREGRSGARRTDGEMDE
jgi:hypothetical protein